MFLFVSMLYVLRQLMF